MIIQPACGRRTRDQQRHPVDAYSQDVLTAIDATELGDNEVTERFGRRSRWTEERTAGSGYQRCCQQHRDGPSAKSPRQCSRRSEPTS
jgi:hypothetical protein